jgi:hypothetical protein
MTATITERTRRDNAGRDRFNGSLTLTCTNTAPSINPAKPIAAGFVRVENQMPAINDVAQRSFRNPTNPSLETAPSA